MSERLVATVEQRRSGASVIKLAGILDEHNKLVELTEQVQTSTALINLAGVERVNSKGTRDWVNWLASLEAKGVQPVLVACSPAIVAQLNLVKNFAGNGIVKSFQVPFHCEACNRTKTVLVHVSELGKRPYQAPSCTCDGCAAEMKFDDETGTYFAFVSQLPKDKPAAKGDSGADLARGSDVQAADEQEKRPSQRPSERRGSRPSSKYLSAFQVGGRPSSQPKMVLIDRTSQRALLPPEPMKSDKPYLIVIVGLLVCTIAVLVFLLMR